MQSRSISVLCDKEDINENNELSTVKQLFFS